MFKKILTKIHLPNWLTIVLFSVFLLRIPSFFEPFYYGDEMIYLTLGQGIRQGIPLYSGLHDNKPPLLYLLAALAGNVFWFKVILALWSIVTIVLFWKLCRCLFPNKEKLHKVAVIIFSLATTLPLLEGNIANAENFLIGLTIGGFLLLFSRQLTFKTIFMAGICFSLAALFKIPAIFDLAAIPIFWLITANLKKTVKNSLPLILGFALPIGLTLAWFWLHGSLVDYLKAAFLQNVGYVSTWRPGDVQKPFLARNLPLFIRAVIVVLSSGILFIFRKKLSWQFLFVSLWLVFILFAVTLSERPYPHYLLQAIAPVSLLLALFFTNRSLEQSLTVAPLLLFFLVPVYYKFWHYPTLTYYQNFIQTSLGQKTKFQYFSWFSPSANRNYKIADFLAQSSSLKEKVFILSPDAPAIYALSRRLPPVKYVADYHINDFANKAQLAKEIAAKLPRFIVLTSGSGPFNEINPILKSAYLPIDNLDGAEIWSLRKILK